MFLYKINAAKSNISTTANSILQLIQKPAVKDAKYANFILSVLNSFTRKYVQTAKLIYP